MDDDDIIKRLWQSVLLVIALWVLNYLMIVGTQKHPTAYALAIVQITEQVFHWLKVVGGISVISTGPIFLFSHFRKERQKERERLAELKKNEEWKQRHEQEAVIEAEREKQKSEQRQIEKDKRQEELNQLRLKKENYLKTRSAEDATKDALRDFM